MLQANNTGVRGFVRKVAIIKLVLLLGLLRSLTERLLILAMVVVIFGVLIFQSVYLEGLELLRRAGILIVALSG